MSFYEHKQMENPKTQSRTSEVGCLTSQLFYSCRSVHEVKVHGTIAISSTHLIIHFLFDAKFKKLLSFISGYVFGLICVYVYWWFAAEYAPTDEIRNEIYSKDGAPRVFAPFVMPFFVMIGYILLSPFLWLICRLNKTKSTISTT